VIHVGGPAADAVGTPGVIKSPGWAASAIAMRRTDAVIAAEPVLVRVGAVGHHCVEREGSGDGFAAPLRRS